MADQRPASTASTANLAEILERVLDKGIVIAGDITISLAEVQLLTIKVRLLIASVDKAQEIGINWWQSDPALSSHNHELEEENRQLRERLDRLEAALASPSSEHTDRTRQDGDNARDESDERDVEHSKDTSTERTSKTSTRR